MGPTDRLQKVYTELTENLEAKIKEYEQAKELTPAVKLAMQFMESKYNVLTAEIKYFRNIQATKFSDPNAPRSKERDDMIQKNDNINLKLENNLIDRAQEIAEKIKKINFY